MSPESGVTIENWRVITEWPNYAVSDHGRVKRLTTRNNAVAGKVLAGDPRNHLCPDGQGRRLAFTLLLLNFTLWQR
ncbi:NUMOD4 domain-containing protein [Paraburkholderia phenoliruptrix]|uniref:NUMOD4 domain-containing protein n=1 Tax=Paraburkholderia phenoliruptrix TaxID=252970 RepID=UPI0009E39059